MLFQEEPYGEQHRACPLCLYLMRSMAIECVRFDFLCPQCRVTHLSDFAVRIRNK